MLVASNTGTHAPWTRRMMTVTELPAVPHCEARSKSTRATVPSDEEIARRTQCEFTANGLATGAALECAVWILDARERSREPQPPCDATITAPAAITATRPAHAIPARVRLPAYRPLLERARPGWTSIVT
jgi:hypothetical protein